LALDRRSKVDAPTRPAADAHRWGHRDEGRQASRRTPTFCAWQSWRTSDRRYPSSGASP